MTIVLGIAVAVLILIIMQQSRRRGRSERAARRRRLFYTQAPAPVSAGTGNDEAVTALWLKLEGSLPDSYAEAVRSRTLLENPDISEQEYAWRWHELKRYFILCALLDSVPMFSPRVDEVWHQMLMFTREYEQFSRRFYGRMLHHAPHAGSQPMPKERAWFDAVYVQCFGWNKYSADLWGRFFTEPLPKEELEMYANRSVDLQQASRWNMHGYRHQPEIRETVDWLLKRLRTHVHTARRGNKDDLIPVNYSHPEVLIFSAIWFSMNEPQGFEEQMVHPEVEKARAHSSGSGCSSASGCGSSDSRDHDSSSSHHHTSDGHHSGGSSCSSSSCSSGCGGGGD